MAKVQPTASNMPNPPAVAAPSSKPGETAPQAKKEKKVKKDRTFHPFFAPDAEGKPTQKVAELGQLAGFDSKVHKPVKRANFAKEEMYYDWKIKQHTDAIAELQKEKEQAKSEGGRDVNKLKKMLERIGELKEKLKGVPGVDVEAMIKAMTEAKAETKDTKAAA